MDLSVEEPNGLQELRGYLASEPERVFQQVLRDLRPPRFPGLGNRRLELGDKLVGKPVGQDGDGGRLVRAHVLKHADYARLQQGVEGCRNENEYKASILMKALGALKEQRTISILAENGILPKYGFPTDDLVELHLPALEQSIEDNRLSLSRGMRQAIREYAPGSEIVAGKELWRSVGIKKLKGHELQKRRYGKCPECGAFVWPIDNFSGTGTCPACKNRVPAGKASCWFRRMALRAKTRGKGYRAQEAALAKRLCGSSLQPALAK